jgi:hypothetical protein
MSLRGVQRRSNPERKDGFTGKRKGAKEFGVSSSRLSAFAWDNNSWIATPAFAGSQ